MATLILTSVGRVIAGPVGGLIGAIAGQAIDQRLLAPKARQGPRLGDLSVQTSSYGVELPRLYGRTRVAGTVIWATDIKETRARVGQGKGRPKVDTYSYSASFAVALSARPILRVERIWADGQLLRGAAGDWKHDAAMRLHTGEEDQAVDPLPAAAEGAGGTPAYRGTAYAVFVDLPLGPFGNRIPSLAFEVVADEGAVAAGAMLAEASGGAVVGAGGPLFDGFAMTGGSLRGVAEAIGQVAPFGLRTDADGRVRIEFGEGGLRTIAVEDVGAESGGKQGVRARHDRRAADELPETLSLAYYDPARDYQPGRQAAARSEGGRGELALQLPAVLDTTAARGLAAARLARLWRERARLRLTLPWRMLGIEPGDVIAVAGVAGRWRVSEVAFERSVLRVTAVAAGGDAAAVTPSDAGRALSQRDVPHGATTIVLVDLPPLPGPPAAGPRLVAAANGASGGWRRAALLASDDGGASYREIGATALPAVIGTVAVALPDGPSEVVDRRNSVVAQLLHTGLALGDADHAALCAGANLATVGDEVLQFGRAEPLGGGAWRLSELWRGRGGTEAATAGHGANERFVLLDAATLAEVPEPGPGVRVMAVGVGDASGVTATFAGTPGRAARPLSPCHSSARAEGGDVVVEWVRRSRAGFGWRDGVDAPLGEPGELYRVTTRAGTREAMEEVTEARWRYPAALRAGDAAAGANVLNMEVRQVGGFGVSEPARLTLAI